MTIEEAVYTVLSSAAGVTALCPASRIKPEGVYQGLERPYIRHFAAGLSVINTHDAGIVTLKMWPYQVSMFADSIASLTALRTAVMAALDASANPKFFITGLADITDLESTDTPVLGQALLLDAWYE